MTKLSRRKVVGTRPQFWVTVSSLPPSIFNRVPKPSSGPDRLRIFRFLGPHPAQYRIHRLPPSEVLQAEWVDSRHYFVHSHSDGINTPLFG